MSSIWCETIFFWALHNSFFNKTLTGNGGQDGRGRGGYNGGGGGYNDRGSYDRGGNRDRYDQGSRGGGGIVPI